MRRVFRGKEKPRKKNTGKGKIGNIATGASGAGSIISAHNVCHSICLGVVALLSVFSISVSSTALMFLSDYNLLFWSMGLFFLIVTVALYVKLGCVSKKAMTANAGIIIAGVPFFPSAQLGFWIVGGAIFLITLGRYIKERYSSTRKKT